MPLSQREKTALNSYLNTQANLQAIKEQLNLGSRKLVPVKHENYMELKWWLKSALLITTDAAGIREAADVIQDKSVPKVVIELSEPPPLNIAAEVKKVTDDCGYGATIRGIYVQLDTAQNKHQPRDTPIGTRDCAKGQMFGRYADEAWHLGHTMDYMANWAADLPIIIEGKKTEHGQSKRVPIDGVSDPVSFEGFCILLGGQKYVSFHCYPNNR